MMNKEDLTKILEKHLKWINNEEDGTRADLTRADLFGADLTRAEINKKLINKFLPLCCPETGSFIGWKKCGKNKIVKLEILEDAKRSSAFGRKCRCSKAKVIDIESFDGNSHFCEAYSSFDSKFVYKIGEIVEVADFDEDRTHECAAGIHFFITRQEAVDY